MGNPGHTRALFKLVVLSTLLAWLAGTAGSVLADPSGRTQTYYAWAFVSDSKFSLPWVPASECSSAPGSLGTGSFGGEWRGCSFHGDAVWWKPGTGACPTGTEEFCAADCPGDSGCYGGQWYEWRQYSVNYPPATVSGSVACPVPGNGGWCRATAALNIVGSEPVAGYSIISIDGDRDGTPFSISGAAASLVIGDIAGATFTYRAVSTFGDSSYAGSNFIKVDSTPPATTAILTGVVGDNGWYTSDVSLTLNATDATSGVAGITLDGAAYAAPITYLAEGGHSHSFYATDNAGNVEPAAAAAFKIDQTPPTIALTSQPYGPLGASFHITGDDPVSGMAGGSLILFKDGQLFREWKLAGGDNTLEWDGLQENGDPLPAGSYFIYATLRNGAGLSSALSGGWQALGQLTQLTTATPAPTATAQSRGIVVTRPSATPTVLPTAAPTSTARPTATQQVALAAAVPTAAQSATGNGSAGSLGAGISLDDLVGQVATALAAVPASVSATVGVGGLSLLALLVLAAATRRKKEEKEASPVPAVPAGTGKALYAPEPLHDEAPSQLGKAPQGGSPPSVPAATPLPPPATLPGILANLGLQFQRLTAGPLRALPLLQDVRLLDLSTAIDEMGFSTNRLAGEKVLETLFAQAEEHGLNLGLSKIKTQSWLELLDGNPTKPWQIKPKTDPFSGLVQFDPDVGLTSKMTEAGIGVAPGPWGDLYYIDTKTGLPITSDIDIQSWGSKLDLATDWELRSGASGLNAEIKNALASLGYDVQDTLIQHGSWTTFLEWARRQRADALASGADASEVAEWDKLIIDAGKGPKPKTDIIELATTTADGEKRIFQIPNNEVDAWLSGTGQRPAGWTAPNPVEQLASKGLGLSTTLATMIAFAVVGADLLKGGQDTNLHYQAGGWGSVANLLGFGDVFRAVGAASRNPFSGDIAARIVGASPLLRAGGVLAAVTGGVQWLSSLYSLGRNVFTNEMTGEQRFLAALNGTSGALAAGGGALVLTGVGAPAGITLLAASGAISAATWIYENREQARLGLAAVPSLITNGGAIIQAAISQPAVVTRAVNEAVVKPAIVTIANGLNSAAGAAQAITSGTRAIAQALPGYVDATVVKPVAQAVSNTVAVLKAAVKTIPQSVSTAVSTSWKVATQAISQPISAAVKAITKSPVVPAVTKVLASPIVQAVAKPVTAVVQQVSSTARQAWNTVTGWFKPKL